MIFGITCNRYEIFVSTKEVEFGGAHSDENIAEARFSVKVFSCRTLEELTPYKYRRPVKRMIAKANILITLDDENNVSFHNLKLHALSNLEKRHVI